MSSVAARVANTSTPGVQLLKDHHDGQLVVVVFVGGEAEGDNAFAGGWINLDIDRHDRPLLTVLANYLTQVPPYPPWHAA
ncbi:MAG: hypothetical protein M3N95_07690 [Actinomycetota bacterium]|nr:hypothetical protein [Actinomycetota bacterium]